MEQMFGKKKKHKPFGFGKRDGRSSPRKQYSTRDRMRDSNRLARHWMLDHGFTWIWFKPHGKRKDWCFTPDGTYQWLDLWGLFDGLCMVRDGQTLKIVPFQIKTNRWAKEDEIISWMVDKQTESVLVVNVKGVKGKWNVLNRYYRRTKWPLNDICSKSDITRLVLS